MNKKNRKESTYDYEIDINYMGEPDAVNQLIKDTKEKYTSNFQIKYKDQVIY